MFIPRFTMKWLLLFVVVAAVFSLLLSMAIRGNFALIALVIAIGSVPLTLLIFAVTFFMSWVIARFFGLHMPTRRGANPFATTKSLPQINRSQINPTPKP